MSRLLHGLLALAFSASISADPLPTQFSKRFEGTINHKLAVTLLLDRDGETLSGSYYYQNKKIPIELYGTMKDDETFTLTENVYQYDGDDVVTGYWSGTIAETGIEAQWKKTKDGATIPCQLKESYTNNSAELQPTAVASSWAKKRNDEEIGVNRSYRYLQLTANNAAAKRINDRLRQHIYGKLDDENPKIARLIPTVGDIEAMAWQPNKDEEEEISWDAPFTNEISFGMKVDYNEQNLLSLSYSHYSYSGGAHGNSSTQHLVYDLKTGSELSLKKVLKPGYEKKFLTAGRAALLAAAGAPPDAMLTEAGLFGNKLELNHNWSIEADGLAFHYDPYEIACYARGYVEFTVPWSVVRPWILPDQALAPLAK